ncbi:hypothetical protein Leryth_017636 [Lithospermum erythrorhizon]|nr:hypothetical protein Leryth_017636 [Lithospermum erythrorhizon]
MSKVPKWDVLFETQEKDASDDELASVLVLRKMKKIMKSQEFAVMLIPILQRLIGPLLENWVPKKVQKEVEITVRKFLASAHRHTKDEVQASEAKSYVLQFKNDPSPLVYTGQEIKTKDGTPVEVVLVDASSGDVVVSGPEAETKLEIVLLEGNDDKHGLASQGFDSEVIGERKETKLGGNVHVTLAKGIGILENIKVPSSRKPMRQGIFKLMAKTVDMAARIHIREAKTKSFSVSDFRNGRSKKNKVPDLSDEVWKLCGVSKNKSIHKCLLGLQIHTVEDLLLQLFKDPERLNHIAIANRRSWEDAVESARRCNLDNKLSSYFDSHEQKGVVFGLVDNVKGVLLGSKYIRVDDLSEKEKVNAHKLAVYALENKKSALSYGDEASLLNEFSSISGFVKPRVAHNLENPQVQHIEASEMFWFQNKMSQVRKSKQKESSDLHVFTEYLVAIVVLLLLRDKELLRVIVAQMYRLLK